MLADIGGNPTQKHFAGCILGHGTNVFADQLHGIASVAVEYAVAIVRLRRAAVDNGDEIISYDDSVLAFLRGIFGDEDLLDNFHWCNFWDIAR